MWLCHGPFKPPEKGFFAHTGGRWLSSTVWTNAKKTFIMYPCPGLCSFHHISLSLSLSLSLFSSLSFVSVAVTVSASLLSLSLSLSACLSLSLALSASGRGARSFISNRQIWSAEEDDAVRRLVEKFGTSGWTLIAENLALAYNNNQGRSGKQCWERWHNHLGVYVLSLDRPRQSARRSRLAGEQEARRSFFCSSNSTSTGGG